jgi:hypothetical protein
MHPTDVPDLSEKSGELYPTDIAVDVEGEWFYRGAKLVREDIVELFLNCVRLNSSMPADAKNAFCIEWKENLCSLEVADTPFVIVRADRIVRDKGGNLEEEAILLTLKHLSTSETLDPSTLYVGEENVLYCRIRGGTFPARFSRPAYYQLAEWIEEDASSGGFVLELNGRRRGIFDFALPAPEAALLC